MTSDERFNKWWEQQTGGLSDGWTTLERLAALDAWQARDEQIAMLREALEAYRRMTDAPPAIEAAADKALALTAPDAESGQDGDRPVKFQEATKRHPSPGKFRVDGCDFDFSTDAESEQDGGWLPMARRLVEAVDALPVEPLVNQDRSGYVELLGYVMKAQGEWDEVANAAAHLRAALPPPPTRAEAEGEG